MEGFNDQLASFISLARALFGDFDIDEILNNSRGYTNAVLFLTYLFVAVFIMLSMFLAILGESQAAVRMDQDEQRAAGTAPPEYGVFSHAAEVVGDAYASLRQRIKPKRARTSSKSSKSSKVGRSTCAETAPLSPSVDDVVSGTRASGGGGTEMMGGGGGGEGDGGEGEGGEGEGGGAKPGGFLPGLAVGGASRTPRIGAYLAGLNHGAGGLGGLHHSGPDAPASARTTHLSIRTEIRELAAELTAVADRQKRMSAHLKHLDPKHLSLQLSRLTAAVEQMEGSFRSSGSKAPAASARPTCSYGSSYVIGGGGGGGDAEQQQQRQRLSGGEGGNRERRMNAERLSSGSGLAGGQPQNLPHNLPRLPSGCGGGQPQQQQHPRHMAMPPMLDVMLGDGGVENYNSQGGGGGGGSDSRDTYAGRALPGSGWAKARRSLIHGRLTRDNRDLYSDDEHRDTPARPRREKAPSMRREVRRATQSEREMRGMPGAPARAPAGGEDGRYVV